MGCDIHCYAEVRKGKKWVQVGKEFKNAYYRPGDTGPYNDQYTEEPYHERNYDLFAMLADVRNGSGFAGCPTGDGFNIISDPKGLPKDVSAGVKKHAKAWGEDGHSHSWHTLKDLLEWNWDQVTVHQGFVTLEEYKTFKEEGFPHAWCGGVGGGNTKVISNAEMDALLDGTKKADKGSSYYTSIRWEESYRGAAGDWWFKETLPALKRLGKPEDVRIVFWFDN